MEGVLIPRIKKLHISVPEDLFYELRESGMLRDIDNIVVELLARRIEEIKKDEGRWG